MFAKNASQALVYVVVIFCTLFSCKEAEKPVPYDRIEKERDSLLELVRNLEDKYIFDSVKVRTIVHNDNSLLPGEKYDAEFFFVGYNENSYLIEYDTIKDGENIIYDTLYADSKGVINFSAILKEGENEIEGFITTDSEFGKLKQGIIYNVITTKKN